MCNRKNAAGQRVVRIVESSISHFEHVGFNCYVYQWPGGMWGGNVDGIGNEPNHFDTKDAAIAATKEAAEWVAKETGMLSPAPETPEPSAHLQLAFAAAAAQIMNGSSIEWPVEMRDGDMYDLDDDN